MPKPVPARLDPFQNIVNVGGGVADFIVGGYNWTTSTVEAADVLIINRNTGAVTVFDQQYTIYDVGLIAIDSKGDPIIDRGNFADSPNIDEHMDRWVDGAVKFQVPDFAFMRLDNSGNAYVINDTGDVDVYDKTGKIIYTKLIANLSTLCFASGLSLYSFNGSNRVSKDSFVDDRPEANWTTTVATSVPSTDNSGINGGIGFGGNVVVFSAPNTITCINAGTGQIVRTFSVSLPPPGGSLMHNPIAFAVDSSGNPIFLTGTFESIDRGFGLVDIPTNAILTCYFGGAEVIGGPRPGQLLWQHTFGAPYAPRGPFTPYDQVPQEARQFTQFYLSVHGQTGPYLGAQGTTAVVQISWMIGPAGNYNQGSDDVYVYGEDGSFVTVSGFPPGSENALAYFNAVNNGLYEESGLFSARIFFAGELSPTTGSMSGFLNGYDTKTGALKFSLTGATPDWGTDSALPVTGDPNGPMSGTLPLIVAAFAAGPNPEQRSV